MCMRIRKDNDILEYGEIELISAASDALAHPLRVELFRFIYVENMKQNKVCNKDLVEVFDYSQSTISQHMNKLTASGLVDVVRKANKSYYFVNLGILGKYLNAVKKLNTPLM